MKSPVVRVIPVVLVCWACAPGAASSGDIAVGPAPTGAAGVARLAVPDPDAVDEARPLVREAFETQFAAARADAGRLPVLVTALVEAAGKTTAPDRSYALLLEAEAAATKAGELPEVLRIVDIRCARFVVDPVQAAIDTLDEFARQHGSHPARLEAVVTAALERSTRAIEASVPDDAERALTVAAKSNSALARICRLRKMPLTKSQELAAMIAERRKLVAEQRERQGGLEAARARLAADADDPAANGVVGGHLCFIIGDWDGGLPALAKGDAADLREAARGELALEGEAEPAAEALFKVANAWWAAAEADGRPRIEADAIKAHAAAIYRGLAGKLPDPIDANLAQRRCGEDVPRPDVRRPVLPEAFRSRGSAAELAVAEGGGADTEAAVDRALQWLASHQLDDGSWSFSFDDCPACAGRCTHSGDANRGGDRAGATAMALLPFLGRGFTHKDGPYRKQVGRGIAFLAAKATAGKGKAYDQGGTMYTQGLVGIALAECYGMSRDGKLATPTQLTLRYIMEAQDARGGGWRYKPGQPGDTSSVGWQIAALQAGGRGAIRIDPMVLKKAAGFLDLVQSDGGAAYGYTDNSSPTPGRTAVGLWCRLATGWKPDHPAVGKGSAAIAATGPTKDLYYGYYATRLLHRTGGDQWRNWNDRMKQLLLTTQSDRDHERGSWFDGVDGGHAAAAAGRLYCTSMAALILEEYYR